MRATPTACQNAREAVSLRLDDELSELGSARLAAHLRACDDCCAYADEVGAVAARLRAAKLEHPGTAVALPAPRRSRTPWLTGAAAAAVAAVVAAASVYVGQSMRGPASLSASQGRSLAVHVDSAQRWRQLLALIPPSDRELIDLHTTRWAA
jgi:predicted anti-sigma-YlaC factor YlaD